MLIRLSGPRLLAILVLSALLAWWMSGNDATELAQLRALSHDALMIRLAQKYDGNYSTNAMGALFVVLITYGGVEMLTRLFERVAVQLGWRRPAGGDAGDSPASPAPFA
jgi:hypothetical protein